MRETALPIGGIGFHPIITAHTGVAHAKLFTDLIEIELDDIFIINVLDETLVYKVDDISVVLPSDIGKLEPIPEKDCVTLITCTPYGINSHRLLVRGERTTKNIEELIEASIQKDTLWNKILRYQAIIVVLLFFLLLIIILIVYTVKTNKYKKEKKN